MIIGLVYGYRRVPLKSSRSRNQRFRQPFCVPKCWHCGRHCRIRVAAATADHHIVVLFPSELPACTTSFSYAPADCFQLRRTLRASPLFLFDVLKPFHFTGPFSVVLRPALFLMLFCYAQLLLLDVVFGPSQRRRSASVEQSFHRARGG